MAKGHLGSFVGTVTANINMIDIFRQTETAKTARKWPASLPFSIQQIAISADPGTAFTLNDAQIVIPGTGVFELSYGLCEVDSLVFDAEADVNIVYLY